MVLKKIKQAVKEKKEYEIEYRIRKSDGQIVWLSDRGRPEFKDGDETTVFNGFLTEITREKEANRKQKLNTLRERVKELQTIYSLSKILQSDTETSLKKSLDKMAEIIRKGFSFPEKTAVKISTNNTTVQAGSVKDIEHQFSEDITVDNDNVGSLTVNTGPQKKNEDQKNSSVLEYYPRAISMEESKSCSVIGLIIYPMGEVSLALSSVFRSEWAVT